MPARERATGGRSRSTTVRARGMACRATPSRLPRVIVDAELDDTEAAVTRVYLALLQHPQPSRPLLVAQGMPRRPRRRDA